MRKVTPSKQEMCAMEGNTSVLGLREGTDDRGAEENSELLSLMLVKLVNGHFIGQVFLLDDKGKKDHGADFVLF